MSEEKSRVALLEEETIKFWQDNNIFAKSIQSRPDDNRFVFYDGPPFATGLPHYGHILSSVTKDIFPRYQTMKGKRVRRRWGWDCHGLPIETLVEKKLGISGKKEIETRGVAEFNQTARSMVLEYADQWKKTVERVGRWVEFDNSYKTMDTAYMESVWWALKEFWNKKLIYEGRKVLMYCPRCETPVSNAETAMDNSYKDVTEESVVVKFKILPNQKIGQKIEITGNEFILAWTTTPWTLPGNVALAVGEQIDYIGVTTQGSKGIYFVASALAESVFKDKPFEIIYRNLKGSDLAGLNYEPLYKIEKVEEEEKRAWYVAPADFVTTEDGTGIVHTAVIYGEDDFNLGQKIGLPQVPLLDSAGKFNEDAPEFLQGRYFKDAEHEIKQDLESRNLLFSRASFTHSYPFCWRCDSPLIYNVISAWFIDIQKNKKRLIELNENINWFPPYLKHGRFLNILESAPDWNISRNRYWATPLPFWKCDKCGHAECIGSIDELKEKSVNFAEIYGEKKTEEIDLHKPYIDEIVLQCSCGEKMTRIPEVIDCWVESGSMPFAEWHYPFENKTEFESRYPGEFIGEYISQTRAWFYYMHTVGSLLFNQECYSNVVATGVILNEKGEKMSKSKQNFPDPAKTINTYGADALRFYIMGSVVMQADNLSFSERELRETYNKIINTLENVVKFYEIYKPTEPTEFHESKMQLLDRYIVSRLHGLNKELTSALDEFNTVRVCRATRSFIDELSTWWLRRSRERFRANDDDSTVAIMTLEYVLKNLAQLIAPLLPFIAERIWQKVKTSTDEESVHLSYWPQIEEGLINEKIESEMASVRKIVEQGHNLRAANSLKVRQPLSTINYSVEFSEFSEEYKKIILEELNVEKFVSKNEIEKPVEGKIDEITVTLETKIDERLQKLGDLRELTRVIQEKRKRSGLKQGEKAFAFYSTDSAQALAFVEEYLEQICQLTDLAKFERSDEIENFSEANLSSGKIKIAI